MKIVFFGTPDYVIPVLEKIHKKFSRRGTSPITAVVTQPPRPSGRAQLLQYSPVDTWAFKRKIPIFHSSREFLNSSVVADFGILSAYGEILPEGVINYFPFGILNTHPSLLPKWRGASPVQATILSREKIAGVSIIKLDQKVDHGPIISQFKEEVLDGDTTETLRKRLFERSAEVLAELLDPYLKGKIAPREQNHAEATFTTQIKKEDAFIPPKYLGKAISGQVIADRWKIPFVKTKSSQASLVKDLTLPQSGKLRLSPTPSTLSAFIRAMDPWPISWTYVQLGKSEKVKGKRLKILSAELTSNRQALIPKMVQLEGKGPVSWKQFKEAYTEATFAE